MGHLARLAWWVQALALLGLAGCQTTPSVGSTGIVQVLALPQTRSALQHWARLDASFAVHEAAIRDSRLLNVRCLIADASAYAGFRTWQGYALAAQRGAAQPGEVVALEADGTAPPTNNIYRLGKVVKNWQALPLVTRAGSPRPANTSDLMCPLDAQGRPAAATVDIPVQTWEWDFAQAERARHSQFSDADFAAGRVAVGACALRDTAGQVYHQPQWLLRVPAGQSLRVGDVVEVVFGEVESGGGVGLLTRMTRPLGTRHDHPGDGRTAVYCR